MWIFKNFEEAFIIFPLKNQSTFGGLVVREFQYDQHDHAAQIWHQHLWWWPRHCLSCLSPPRPRRSVRHAVTGAPSRPSPHTHITALAVTTKTNRFLTHEAGCHNTTFHDRNSIKILKLIKSGMSCFSYVKCRYIQRYKFPYLHIYMIVHFLSRPQHCSDYCSF